MRLLIAVTLLALSSLVSPASAQSDSTGYDNVQSASGRSPHTPDPSDELQPQDQDAAPVAKPAKPERGHDGSLLDLKDAQDKADQGAEYGSPPAIDAGRGACPSREIAAALRMPNVKKFKTPDGSLDKAKASKCKELLESFEEACAPEADCSACDKAVKAFSTTCSYVQSESN